MLLPRRTGPSPFAPLSVAAALLASSIASAQAPAAGAGPPPASSATPPAPPAPRDLPPAPRPSDGVHFKFTADAWFPRFTGDSTFGGARLDIDDDLDLSDNEASFDARADVRFDRLSVGLSGFAFSASGESDAAFGFSWGGVAVAGGDRFRSDIDMDSVALEVGYLLWRPFSDQPTPWSATKFQAENTAPNGDYRLDLRFEPFAGFRWVGIEQSLTNSASGASNRYDEDWLAIYGGLRVEIVARLPEEIPFLDRLVIHGSGGFGGVVSGGSGPYYQVRAGLDLYLTPNIALSGGYQLIHFDADDGDFELDGGLQGLFAGLTIAF